MKAFFMGLLLIICTLTSAIANFDSGNHTYRNAIGVKLIDGISYKRFYSKTSLEVSLGGSWSDWAGFALTNQYMFYFQKKGNRFFKPYIGGGIIIKKISYTILGYHSKSTEHRLFFGPGVKAGFDLIPKNSRFFYCLDAGYGYTFVGNKKEYRNKYSSFFNYLSPKTTLSTPLISIGFRYKL